MKTASFTICRPDTGAVLPLAKVTVYQADGMTRASIFKADGTAQSNPLTVDQNGAFTIAAADGTYIFSPVSADGSLLVPPITVDLYDLPAIAATMSQQVSAAATSAAQALQASTTAQGFCNSLPIAATALPFEVTAISGGVGTGSGGTPGTYALGVTGGPPGFKATVTIGGDGKIASYAILNPGIATTNSAPTLSLSGVTGLTGATTPTATVGTVPVGRVFIAPSSDGQSFLAWMNSAGALSQFPTSGTQYSQPNTTSLNSRIRFLTIDHPRYAAVFGAIGGPIVAGVTYDGSWEFLGVNVLPIKAPDGTVAVRATADSSSRTGYIWRVYDSNSGAILFGLKDDGTFVAKMSIVEITQARGSEADLNARLSRGLTAAGSPKTGSQNAGRMANWRSALTFLKNGGTALAHAIFDMDSWGDGKAYGNVEAITRFYAESGLTNAGPGWIGFASSVGGGTAFHGTARNNITVARTGTWTDLFRSADGTPGTPQNFPGYDAAQSGADGSIYTITSSQLASATYLRLFCGKGSGIEYSWDGTTYTALTITAGSGSTYVDISLAGKTNSLRLRCANGAVVAGLFCLTAASGVVFSNFGNSGATAAQKATVQSNADYRAMMAAMPADTITALIQLGLNDTKAGTANATIVTNVAAVAAGYRAIYTGFPSCDVAILCQPNTPLSVQDTLAPLLRAWAEDNGAAFLDWQTYFGTPSYSGDYSGYARDYTSGAASTALPLLDAGSDYRHPSFPGTAYSAGPPVVPATGLIGAGKSAAVTGAGVVASGLSNLLLSPLRSN